MDFGVKLSLLRNIGGLLINMKQGWLRVQITFLQDFIIYLHERGF